MEFLIQFKLYLFIMSILFILKNIYSFIKIMRLKEGKLDDSWSHNILLGSAISYIIIFLIS